MNIKTRILILLLPIVLLASCSQHNVKDRELVNAMSGSDSVINNSINSIPQFTTGYDHKVMVLGTFHFNKSTDGSDVVAKNHIDITSDENQKLIEELASKIADEYKPTIIAVEWMPSYQNEIDSLYINYNKTGSLLKNEAFQIGFRIAKKMNLQRIYCVDNRPPQPESVMKMELDFYEYLKLTNQETLVGEYDNDNKAYNDYMDNMLSQTNVLQYLKIKNSKENLKRYKALSFTGLVNAGYKDNYIGADFTGMWYQRNTRIFVNIRNLTKMKNERILVIYGAAHKWVLDEIFDGSPEFEVVQPFSYEIY